MKKLKISRLTPDSRYLQTVALNWLIPIGAFQSQLEFGIARWFQLFKTFYELFIFLTKTFMFAS